MTTRPEAPVAASRLPLRLVTGLSAVSVAAAYTPESFGPYDLEVSAWSLVVLGFGAAMAAHHVRPIVSGLRRVAIVLMMGPIAWFAIGNVNVLTSDFDEGLFLAVMSPATVVLSFATGRVRLTPAIDHSVAIVLAALIGLAQLPAIMGWLNHGRFGNHDGAPLVDGPWMTPLAHGALGGLALWLVALELRAWRRGRVLS